MFKRQCAQVEVEAHRRSAAIGGMAAESRRSRDICKLEYAGTRLNVADFKFYTKLLDKDRFEYVRDMQIVKRSLPAAAAAA